MPTKPDGAERKRKPKTGNRRPKKTARNKNQRREKLRWDRWLKTKDRVRGGDPHYLRGKSDPKPRCQQPPPPAGEGWVPGGDPHYLRGKSDPTPQRPQAGMEQRDD